jgi:hypothetical protein
VYWIYKTEFENTFPEYFVGTEQHIDALISDGVPISYHKKYDVPLKSGPKKLYIVGAGRAGTTFLVQLLTRMGYFTGYLPYREKIHMLSRAGCEYSVRDLGDLTNADNPKRLQKEFSHHPFIMKSPIASWYLKYIALVAKVPIAHALIPVRDHIEVATSRVKEKLFIPLEGEDIENQIQACDILLGKAVEACVTARVPFSIVRFPELVQDKDYCWNEIRTALSDCFSEDPDEELFSVVFNELSNPSMIKYSGVYQY